MHRPITSTKISLLSEIFCGIHPRAPKEMPINIIRSNIKRLYILRYYLISQGTMCWDRGHSPSARWFLSIMF